MVPRLALFIPLILSLAGFAADNRIYHDGYRIRSTVALLQLAPLHVVEQSLDWFEANPGLPRAVSLIFKNARVGGPTVYDADEFTPLELVVTFRFPIYQAGSQVGFYYRPLTFKRSRPDGKFEMVSYASGFVENWNCGELVAD